MIDASGTWTAAEPGRRGRLPGDWASGRPPPTDCVSYLPPTPEQAADLAGRHMVVVGSGHSAMTAVIELAAVARRRAGHPDDAGCCGAARSADTFGGGTADELPQRGALGLRARQAVEDGLVELVTGFRVDRIEPTVTPVGWWWWRRTGGALAPADRVVVLTGFRPDLSFLSEMRLELDPVLQAPRAAGAGDRPEPALLRQRVSPHGAAELAHPEPGLYLVGMKSYGRAPTFLAMTGYEQVRSVAAELDR